MLRFKFQQFDEWFVEDSRKLDILSNRQRLIGNYLKCQHFKSLSLLTTLTAIESLSAPQTTNDIDSLKT